MKKIIILFLIIAPFVAQAQQLKIYTDESGYNYFALYAYGLPREVVKTNQEIKDSKFGESGITRRHHTTKYEDKKIGAEGYNANQKISFAFLIAPYNVDESGQELKDINNQRGIDWYSATGWDRSIDSDNWVCNTKEDSKINATPTGCAAYTGPTQKDPPGTWRLPTQREAMIMFSIMEHALTLQGANQVTNLIINGKYWSSTEFFATSFWKVWYVDSHFGSVINENKMYSQYYIPTAFARCVRDIDNDPIND